MDRGIDIYVPLVRGQNTMGRGLDIPSVGGRYTIHVGRESKYHGWGVNIP